MAKKTAEVTVKLTRAQARALLYAIGNSIDAPCDAKALFPEARERRAADEGRRALEDAMYAGTKDEI